MAKIIFLGTGTSSGVPIPGCRCDVCTSEDPKDNRLRTSAYIELDNGAKILIDAGPDLRQQILRYNIEWIDGILITHSHQDHIGGIDELRQLNFIMKRRIPVYGNRIAIKEIKNRFSYIFRKTQEGGGKPEVDLITVKSEFKIANQKIIPIPVLHGKIPILGYRMDGLSYITDASFISDNSKKILQGTKILVINALRYERHPTHFSIGEAIEISKEINPEKTFFVHLTHHFKHNLDSRKFPEGVYFAYDGLEVYF